MKIELSGSDKPLLVKNIVSNNYIEVTSISGIIISSFFKIEPDKKIIIIKKFDSGIKVYYFNDVRAFYEFKENNKDWNKVETIYDSTNK